MSAVEYRFLEPLDVLFLRGNKLFGDPGSFGESLIPPWPSVAAGALRSRILADAGVDLSAFARGEVSHPELGTPDAPGPFTVAAFHLARRHADGPVEPLVAPPADLVLSRDDSGVIQVRSLTPNPTQEPVLVEGVGCADEGGASVANDALRASAHPTQSRRLYPVPGNSPARANAQVSLPGGEGLEGRASILSSAPLPQLPVLAESERSKPVSGYWLTAAGWEKYLKGETPSADDFIPSSQLWTIDPRVGVGLDAASRRAAEGRLFSVQAVAMKKREHTSKDGFDVGFLVGVTGANPPAGGTVRLGGDGRAAAIRPALVTLPEPDFEAIAQARRCSLVLTSPGLFAQGWLPTGVTRTADGEYRFELCGVKGRLLCAAVPRFEVVSGWDLARWQPKPAQRAAPTGSVYWLDELTATLEALRKLAEKGLWTDAEYDKNTRRAEGFNRVALAQWM
jgi:CRISPR-associated protein Cmr3